MADQPVSTTRKPRRRVVRLFKVGTARSALADFGPGMETTCYTFGQFSIVDAIVAVLQRTGPADVVVSTWTAAAADLRRSSELMRDGHVRSCRWVVDHSFASRQPEFLDLMRDLFGPDCIRPLRTHAKFVLIGNDDWHVVIRTSMNLNENKRLENLDVCDDEDFYRFHLDMVDGLFADSDGSDWVDHDDLDLTGIAATPPPGMVEMGSASAGRAQRGVASVGNHETA